MIALIGLGNPGQQYYDNRHNVGFLYLDYLADRFGDVTGSSHANRDKYTSPQTHSSDLSTQAFTHNTRLLSETCTISDPPGVSTPLLLVKPQTFMNRSGHAVSRIMQEYKLKPAQLIVIHDDLDIVFGNSKITTGRGPKIHNGITSIDEAIGPNYTRLRIGIDNRTPDHRPRGEEYVLGNFSVREVGELASIFDRITPRLLATILEMKS